MRFIKTALLAAAMSLAAIHSAYAEPYWVLGSFEKESNAFREKERINASLSLAAAVSQAGTHYRVVVAVSNQPSKSPLEEMGFSPWRTEDVNLVEASPAASRMIQEVKEVTEHYRVLASFVDEPSAKLLADRLKSDGVDRIDIRPAEVNNLTFFRVLQGPFNVRTGSLASMEAYGLGEPWWLSIASSESGQTTSSPAQISEATPQESTSNNQLADNSQTGNTTTSEEAGATPEPVYTISPPRPGESHIDYCLKRANKMERAIFCKNNMFNRIGIAQMQGGTTDDALMKCIVTAGGTCQDSTLPE